MKKGFLIVTILFVSFSIFIYYYLFYKPVNSKMVYISEGRAEIGSNDKDSNSLAKEFGSRQKVFYMNEKPVRVVLLKGFYIDKFEVSNQNYKLFINKTGYPHPLHWENGTFKAGREHHPVINIKWIDAETYCLWAGKRLPTEEEWEKAARGPLGSRYPWGDDFDENKANLTSGDTLPVGSMPEDKSYYGIYDMGGNVMEWTSSWYKPYPGSTFQLNEYGEKYRVIRGSAGNVIGHYHLVKIYSRSSYRHYYDPKGNTYDVGFRCSKKNK